MEMEHLCVLMIYNGKNLKYAFFINQSLNFYYKSPKSVKFFFKKNKKTKKNFTF